MVYVVQMRVLINSNYSRLGMIQEYLRKRPNQLKTDILLQQHTYYVGRIDIDGYLGPGTVLSIHRMLQHCCKEQHRERQVNR